MHEPREEFRTTLIHPTKPSIIITVHRVMYEGHMVSNIAVNTEHKKTIRDAEEALKYADQLTNRFIKKGYTQS